MAAEAPVREGYVAFRGYRTWYRIVGEREAAGKFPLLVLHGGPGASYDYLEPIGAIAATGRRVVFYDQLGGGNSDHPSNPALWTPELFVEEVGAVRDALGLERTHLLGQSWGGVLAMEYALTQPAGLLSLVIANSPASMPQFLEGVNQLRELLPMAVQQTLLRHEAAGTTDDPEYEAAMHAFYRRHLCRSDPWPDCLLRTFEQMSKYPEVYRTMNGPSEFHVIGTIKDWDVTDRLGEIRVPALIVAAHHDEVTPGVAAIAHRGIAGSEWVLFEHSAHCPHLEEPARYMAVLDDFLIRVEATTWGNVYEMD